MEGVGVWGEAVFQRKEGVSLRKWMGRGMVGRTDTCHVPESLMAPAHLYPTMLSRIPLFWCPHPPPHLTHLCYRSWREEGRPARGAAAGGSWYGVVKSRAGPGDGSPLGASSPLIAPWGRDAGGPPRRGGKTEGRRAETEGACRPH